MLDLLENRITAIIGDALAGRAHLSVIAGPDDPAGLAPGNGVVTVQFEDIAPSAHFVARYSRLDAGPPPTDRRVLPLEIGVVVKFALNPPGPPGNPDRAAARTLLLADLSTLVHALGTPDIIDGRQFRPAAPDPGYFVHSFELRDGALVPELTDGLLTSQADWRLRADIWPAGVTQDLGMIDAVDVFIGAVPLRISATRQRLRVGETTELRISGLPLERLTAVDNQTRSPAQLALRVESELPPADRGRILSGTDGAEAGLRLIPAADGAYGAEYAAPTGPLGATNSETIAIYVATPGGGRGIFLGGLSIGLNPDVAP